jgi:hypothetical protein
MRSLWTGFKWLSVWSNEVNYDSQGMYLKWGSQEMNNLTRIVLESGHFEDWKGNENNIIK